MMLNAENIRKHEEEYINRLKERFAKNAHVKKSRTIDKPKSQFNLFSKAHDEEFKEKDQEKAKRRKKFLDRLRKIPVPIDEEKRKMALIGILRNKMGYIFTLNLFTLNRQILMSFFKVMLLESIIL